MEEKYEEGNQTWSERDSFCQRTKWMEAREAWISGDREKAKKIEHEIYLHMNPWTWVKEQAGKQAEEGVFGSKRMDF